MCVGRALLHGKAKDCFLVCAVFSLPLMRQCVRIFLPEWNLCEKTHLNIYPQGVLVVLAGFRANMVTIR